MAQSGQIPVHCYTNPSFCGQSEYIPGNKIEELPPPPQQFQTDELPPPPPPTPPQPIQQIIHANPIPIQNQQIQNVNYQQAQYGHTNPAFQQRPEQNCIELDTRVRYAKIPDRYCYLEDDNEKNPAIIQETQNERQIIYNRTNRSRYEYIDDDEPLPPPNQPQNQLQRRGSLTRYELITQRQNQPFTRQGTYHGQRMQSAVSMPLNQEENETINNQRVRRIRQDGNDVVRYALVPADEAIIDGDSSSWINGSYSSSAQGIKLLCGLTIFKSNIIKEKQKLFRSF